MHLLKSHGRSRQACHRVTCASPALHGVIELLSAHMALGELLLPELSGVLELLIGHMALRESLQPELPFLTAS